MERQYREMFDEVRSSSRLREEVTRMTMMERKPARRRLPKKVLLAAAVLVVLAGTAVAAVSAPGTLKGWFVQEWQETTGTAMDEAQLALIDELTRPVGVSDTRNGTTVTVDSVTVGDSTIWMLLKISGEYTENTDLRYDFDGMDLTIDPYPDEVGTPGGYGVSVRDWGVTEDGMLGLLIVFTIHLGGQTSLLDSHRQVTLVLNDLVSNNIKWKGDKYKTVAEGAWTLTFPLEPGEMEKRTLEEIRVPGTNRDTGEVVTMTLRDVQITSTDITYTLDATPQAPEVMLTCSLVMDNGAEVGYSNGATRFLDEERTQWSSVWYWRMPVDLSRVTALRFGDVEIPLN